MEGIIFSAYFGPNCGVQSPVFTGIRAAVSFFGDNRFIGRIALH